MIWNEKINNLIKKNNGIVTTRQLLALGVSKTTLANYLRSGFLERASRGVYTLADEFPDEMYALSLRSGSIVFSHETALFLHDMAERAPLKYSVTIPSNRSVSPEFRGSVRCFYINPALADLGLTKRRTLFGNLVPCYNLERTVCDMVRSRNRLETEVVFRALKDFLRREDRNLVKLFQYAKLLRVEKTMRLMLEVLS